MILVTFQWCHQHSPERTRKKEKKENGTQWKTGAAAQLCSVEQKLGFPDSRGNTTVTFSRGRDPCASATSKFTSGALESGGFSLCTTHTDIFMPARGLVRAKHKHKYKYRYELHSETVYVVLVSAMHMLW